MNKHSALGYKNFNDKEEKSRRYQYAQKRPP